MKINAINRIISLSLFSSLALAGCISDGEDEGLLEEEGVELGTTEQAVSWTALKWHSCTSKDCTVNLGSSDNRTCFLAGLRGKLASGLSGYPAGANIVNNGSWDYNLYIENPLYEDISVMTVCIGNTANRVTANWQAGQPATLIPAGPNNTRRCFLSGIWNRSSTAFSTFASNTKVWRDGNQHFLGGSLPAGSSTSVNAVCVDVATHQGEYAWGNGVSTSYAGNLTYNPASGGVACGLTGIGGQFTTNNPGRGVLIGYNSGTRFWNWTMSPWTGGNALCVK
jgi:hypothetical protein